MNDPDRRIPQASYVTPSGADETVPRAPSADVIGPANAVVEGVPAPSQDATAAPPPVRRGLAATTAHQPAPYGTPEGDRAGPHT